MLFLLPALPTYDRAAMQFRIIELQVGNTGGGICWLVNVLRTANNH
ncbi:6616_t:CDS:2 [Paraglomus occultum]|uniref:6616_t:CDS:1 n=1 Tax=Paraglomus occultum TaxID=144539 RepID=A0A9N8W0U3_9GLOM|nr:6616_t:CDS:2 [Paraglomus occultum]